MVKKICIIFSFAALLPLSVASAQRGPDRKAPKGDRELIEMEDRLDREADRLMKGDKGGELALGIIGAIADLAFRTERGSGGGKWHPGYGRHHRQYKCVAQNARRQRFQADGYVQQRVAQRALRVCQNASRDRWGKSDRRLARSCKVISCRPSRW